MGARVYAGLSAEQRADRRREQLLAAGLDVFAERGWSGSTVQDLCRAAGLSPRYFYELVDSREALFLAVNARIAEQLAGVVRQALVDADTDTDTDTDADPESRAHAFLTALVGYFSADARVVRLALVESMATEQFRAQRRELLAGFASSAARLLRALRVGPAGGAAGRRRLELSAAVLIGGLVEALIARTGEGRPLQVELFVDHLTALHSAAAQL